MGVGHLRPSTGLGVLSGSHLVSGGSRGHGTLPNQCVLWEVLLENGIGGLCDPYGGRTGVGVWSIPVPGACGSQVGSAHHFYGQNF